VGAIHCLLENGLRVPEDVAVIGCGNLRMAAYLEVPLSTIDQSPARQGAEAARLALSMISRERKGKTERFLVEPKLIARDSTIGHAKESSTACLPSSW
jgi:LacI family transcriptional regulator